MKPLRPLRLAVKLKRHQCKQHRCSIIHGSSPLSEEVAVLPVPLILQVLSRYEPQGCAVNTVAHSRGRRAVVEQVPQVTVAMPAADFSPHH